jgi:hypothetical protein
MRLVLASILLHFDLSFDESRLGDDWLDQESYFLWAKKPLFVKLKSVIL